MLLTPGNRRQCGVIYGPEHDFLSSEMILESLVLTFLNDYSIFFCLQLPPSINSDLDRYNNRIMSSKLLHIFCTFMSISPPVAPLYL